MKGIDDPEETLEHKIDRASRQLDLVRREYHNANRRRDVFVIIIFLAAGIGIWVGVRGRQAQDRANRDTQNARFASCLQYNVQQTNNRAAAKVEIRKLADFLAPLPHSVDEQAEIDRDLASYDATVDKDRPFRDCTPEGIARYLSGAK
jgi:hypothetical protein